MTPITGTSNGLTAAGGVAEIRETTRTPSVAGPVDLVIVAGPGIPLHMINSLRNRAEQLGQSVHQVGDGVNDLDLDDIASCHKLGLLGPGSQAAVLMHGSIENGVHVLDQKKGGDGLPTALMMRTLRGIKSGEPDHSAEGNKAPWDGMLHLVSCEAGKLRETLQTDAELWDQGLFMLHNSGKKVFSDDAQTSLMAVIEYTGECKRGHEPADQYVMLARIAEVSGESLTLGGKEMQAPILLRAPKHPDEIMQDHLMTAYQSTRNGGRDMLSGAQENIAKLMQAKRTDRLASMEKNDEKKLASLLVRIGRNKIQEAAAMLQAFPKIIDGQQAKSLAIERAIQSGNLKMLRLILETGDIHPMSKGKASHLITALNMKRPDLVELLIEYGADKYETFQEGMSFLHLAVLENFEDIAAYLAEDKNLVNATNESGAIPLHLASGLTDSTMFDLLIDNGAIAGALDFKQRSILHYAVINDSKEIARHLAQNKILLNAPDEQGNTPLHHAVLQKNLAMVKILLDAKASRLAKNEDGLIPALLARRSLQAEISQEFSANRSRNKRLT